VLRPCVGGPKGDFRKLKKHPLGKLLWFAVFLADAYISQTPTMSTEMIAEGIPEEKIVMIPNALTTYPPIFPSDQIRLIARDRCELEHRPTVLFVGRIVPEKGLDILIRAWIEISRIHKAQLVLVGDGPEKRRITDWTRKANCSASVKFMGWRYDIQNFYQASDIFVFPPIAETYGNVIAEAMAHGLALITTPVGIAKHWIRDGENGLLISGASTNELIEAMVRLLDNVPLCKRLGRQAREDVTRLSNPDSILKYHLDLYERIIKTRPLPPIL
jgi:glycosyltransferase involved in cell wall biosynthesis